VVPIRTKMPDDAFSGLLDTGAAPSFSQPAAPTPQQRAPSKETSTSPQFAVRGRLNAIVLDLLLVGIATRLLLVALGDSAQSADALLVLLGLQFTYFFVYEARTGQTIGKRMFHVRVGTLTGAPLTGRQVAIRNAFRIVDALPIFYASGLLSIMRTGRARRQRIGDVVAGTVVVLDAHGKPLRTPRWLLPITTILATVVSVAVLVPILNNHRQTNIPVAHGFDYNTGQAPVEGSWLATTTTTSSIGYRNMAPGEQLAKRLRITRNCTSAGICSFVILLNLPHEPPTSTKLIPRTDGWHAAFPTRLYPCGYTATGRTIYWQQHSTMVFRFANAGTSAEANERDFSEAASCGYGTDTVVWTAKHL
jgi:uncharacterized RDD family membrane protein YckC